MIRVLNLYTDGSNRHGTITKLSISRQSFSVLTFYLLCPHPESQVCPVVLSIEQLTFRDTNSNEKSTYIRYHLVNAYAQLPDVFRFQQLFFRNFALKISLHYFKQYVKHFALCGQKRNN